MDVKILEWEDVEQSILTVDRDLRWCLEHKNLNSLLDGEFLDKSNEYQVLK
jgi:hypothetical protein